MGRPRTPIGTFGDISYAKTASGQIRARTRFRDDDGQIRRVSATGPTRKAAERNLKEVLSQRTSRAAYAELTPDSSFKQLVELWLEDLDLEGKLAPSTRALYERNIRQLVMPVFEHYGADFRIALVPVFRRTPAERAGFRRSSRHRHRGNLDA
jgi:hypothetical protein